MEQKYLIDTNVIIDNFGDKLPVKAKQFLNNLDIIISAVTKIEILGWHHATERQLKPLYAFMKQSIILPIDDVIIDKTIFIRQSQKIALADAIIAATSIVYRLTLLTHNIDDFKNIKELQVIDPYKL